MPDEIEKAIGLAERDPEIGVAAKLARIPLSQLQAQKLIVNQAYENMGDGPWGDYSQAPPEHRAPT